MPPAAQEPFEKGSWESPKLFGAPSAKVLSRGKWVEVRAVSRNIDSHFPRLKTEFI